MKLDAVYHRTSDQWCYTLNEEELIVNIRTGYDVERVFIYHGDPFESGILGGDWAWTGQKEEIHYNKNLKYHRWWTTTLRPPFKRCRYYFELWTKEDKYYYFEDGFLLEEELQKKGNNTSCFIFPWMNPADINRTPTWVNDTVWYQIFPERFCNGDNSLNPEGVKPWGYHEVKNEEFYGGDLQGIINQLDYIKHLGINGIYLTPIFKAPSAHKYDTADYKKIDSHFGDEEVFRRLVEESHNRGIRIMLDGVFNHCGRDFAPWQDVLNRGPESPYYHWFMIKRWPFEREGGTRDGRFYSFAFADRMPKLNTNNPEVRKYLLEVVEYWMKNFEIDGLRLDVANEVSHVFCKELRILAKSINPEFYILGEVWHDSIEWLRGYEFDAVMNYPLRSTISNFWINKKESKEDFARAINGNYTMYMQQTNDVMFNLLDSHDTNRLMNQVKDKDIFYQQLAVLFTMPGSPCIYYGTEIAMEGGYDPDCRRCMPWEEIENDIYKEEIKTLTQLIQLRKSNPLFKSRNFHFPNRIKNPRVLEYIKIDNQFNKIEVLLNCSDELIDAGEGDAVLFERLCNGNEIESKGILIRYLKES